MSEKMPWLRYSTRTLCGFPALLLASFYATWGTGRLALPVLALVCLFKRPEGWLDRLLELVFGLAFFFVLFIFTAWDPHSVIEWFSD